MASKKVLIFAAVIFTFIIFCGTSDAASYKRIVSLYPGHTDNIIALGGGGRLVAISKNDAPEVLPNLPRLTMKTGAEKILALRPDLVIIRTLVEQQNPELKKVLTRSGVRVEVIDPPSWNGFDEYLMKLAPLVGSSPQKAQKKLNNLRSVIIAKTANAKKKNGNKTPSVFIEATEKEIHTCAPDSWAAHLIELAGGENAAKSAVPSRKGSSIAPWGAEKALKLAASGLNIYLIQNGVMNASDRETFMKRPWSAAFKNVKVSVVRESYLSRPSLLGLEQGGKMLIKIFYEE